MMMMMGHGDDWMDGWRDGWRGRLDDTCTVL